MWKAWTGRWAVALMVAMTVACGGDDGGDGPTGPSTPNGTMTAVVDGNSWAAVQIAATRNNGFLAISGSDASLLAVAFALQESQAGTGTYPIGPGFATTGTVISNTTNSWTAGAAQGSGSITINELTESGASGTFSFTALATLGSGDPPQRVVTTGQFNVTFN